MYFNNRAAFGMAKAREPKDLFEKSRLVISKTSFFILNSLKQSIFNWLLKSTARGQF